MLSCRFLVLALVGAVASACAPAAQPTSTPETPMPQSAIRLHPELTRYVEALPAPSIDDERRAALDRLAAYVVEQRNAGTPVRLTFICTHNSRRSHISQLWAAVAAAYHGVPGVETYSGGTEATAFNPRAVAALQRAGFHIESEEPDADNPRYAVTFSPEGPTLTAFSKVYGDPPNPTDGFAAIMTCSQADASCPAVFGADTRLSIPYVDPKVADDTDAEAATYDERVAQIAAEMFYVFERVAAG